jgi:transglutaminase-like putative cysteine protease
MNEKREIRKENIKDNNKDSNISEASNHPSNGIKAQYTDPIDNEIDEIDNNGFKKTPLYYILVFFVIFILILWIIPSYSLKKYQNPKNIPSLSSFKISSLNYTRYNFTNINDIYKVVNNPDIKDISNSIAVQSCDNGNRLCYAKSLYYFVRDNIKYINDPVNEEYIENPLQVLASQGADCESGAALLVSMLRSIGIPAEFVFIPNHAFVKAILPEAPRTYKRNGNIVYLEWTCKSCKFGEIPLSDQRYLEK